MAKRKAHVQKKSDVNGKVNTAPVIPAVRYSDELPTKRRKWTNKQRVLVFSSRGITHRSRHFMNNLRTLLPHAKPETKMEKKDNLFVVNEICEMKNCNKCIYLESKKKQDLYFWISNIPNGPSAKFLTENTILASSIGGIQSNEKYYNPVSVNYKQIVTFADDMDLWYFYVHVFYGGKSETDISDFSPIDYEGNCEIYEMLYNTHLGFLVIPCRIHTMEELKMTGNCLKSSRSLLSFDKNFTDQPHLALLKELFVQVFGTPYHHPKSQPFIDRVFCFSYLDNRIWFRNYQIIEEDGSLAEIGPRFVLNPICIFDGSFGGTKLWENPEYITPNKHRRMLREAASHKYKNRVTAKLAREERKEEEVFRLDPTDLVFQTIPPEEAVGSEKNTFYRKS